MTNFHFYKTSIHIIYIYNKSFKHKIPFKVESFTFTNVFGFNAASFTLPVYLITCACQYLLL